MNPILGWSVGVIFDGTGPERDWNSKIKDLDIVIFEFVGAAVKM